MSYRISKDGTDSMTPYANSRQKDSTNNPQLKQSLNRKVNTSHNRVRPMSYTFNNPIIINDKNQYANRVMSAHKNLDMNIIHNMRSNSRKERIGHKGGNNNEKKIKRAETVGMPTPNQTESKIKLKNELNEMSTLKYHISIGRIEKEYRITPTILGTGSYAIVKLAENLLDPEQKVAVKIYEKNKLYTNKHRRKNL